MQWVGLEFGCAGPVLRLAVVSHGILKCAGWRLRDECLSTHRESQSHHHHVRVENLLVFWTSLARSTYLWGR